MPSPEDLALIASIADDLAAGVWVATAPDGRFVYANTAFGEIMGMGPVPEASAGEYATNYGIFTRSGEPYPENAMPFARALAAKTTVIVDDIVIHRRGGSRIYVRAHARPMRDPSGEITHVAIAFFDITREAMAEDARARADAERANLLLRELEARNQSLADRQRAEAKLIAADRLASLGVLAAGVAHEINGPLSYVIGNVDLAIEKLARPTSTDDVITLLRDVRQGAERVRTIVRDLRVFSHRADEKADVVDVRLPLEVAIKLAQNELRHRAALVTELGEIPPVWGDEGKLAQVFLNLLINAAQAIPEGRRSDHRVTVRTRSFSDELGSAWARVEFIDSGEGIPSAIVEKIFDPFFTTKPVGVGTGLGLSICQAIVGGLGGKITVESQLGKGSTFRVDLPGTIKARREPTPVERRPAPVRSRRRVLVVDDDALILKVIRAILAEDHEVESESRAAAAFARIERGERFDVILCDLMMPFMTGMDLHARVSAIAPEQAATMVFLTGGAFTDRARAFVADTRNPMLEKPFDGNELLRAIADVRP